MEVLFDSFSFKKKNDAGGRERSAGVDFPRKMSK